jgi:hypothetical protein
MAAHSLCSTRVGCPKYVLGSAMVAQAQFPRDRRSRRFMEVGSITDSEWQQSYKHGTPLLSRMGKRGKAVLSDSCISCISCISCMHWQKRLQTKGSSEVLNL